MTLGHQGLLSLTPAFLLAFAVPRAGLRPAQRAVTWLTWGLTAVVLTFYITRTSNYGGLSCGPRWFAWLTPLYLLAMVPAVDRLGETAWGRRVGYAMLAVSVFTASYRWAHPWAHPWLYDLFRVCGWADY